MPFHTQAGLASKNKFIFDDEMAASSDDEGIPMDPTELLNKATSNAVKNAKAQAKAEAAKAKAIAPKKVEPEQPVKKREPRANNQPRKGPRKERIVEDKDGFVAENNNKNSGNAPARENNNNRRQNRRPRNSDKKSGDPKTGRKAVEKKGGAGSGNWGKNDENLEETVKELVEEEKAEQAEENKTDNEAENDAEPEEPKIQYLTLEEYEASLNAGDASTVANKENVRVANDGQELKGKQVERKKLYNNQPAKSGKVYVRENAKQVINADFVGHFAKGDNDRRDRRGGRNNNNERKNAGNKQNKGKMAAIDDVSAFPALGK